MVNGALMIRIRRAEPSDAGALSARRGGRPEPGAWLLTTEMWRAVGEERRYLRAARRHADAAVFVVEDGAAIVGRLSSPATRIPRAGTWPISV